MSLVQQTIGMPTLSHSNVTQSLYRHTLPIGICRKAQKSVNCLVNYNLKYLKNFYTFH
jgi:hypothetical protein